MKKNKLSFMISALCTFLTHRIKPLFVSWVLTYRCNKNCLYCGTRDKFDNTNEELPTQKVCDIIAALVRLGTKFITFTGGEPFIREDIDDIVRFASKRNMLIKINSNGGLWNKHQKIIPLLHKVQLSLDGPQEIHDVLRGKNSYEEVIDSASIIKAKGGNFYFSSVLTEQNFHYVDFLLELAGRFKAKVLFQPISPPVNTEVSPFKENFLSFLHSKSYKDVIRHLIQMKLKKNPFIMNSLSGLHYLSELPEGPKPATKIRCCAGRCYFRITPQGQIYGCVARYNPVKISSLELLPQYLDTVSKSMPLRICKDCYCAGLVETNLMFSLDINAILNASMV